MGRWEIHSYIEAVKKDSSLVEEKSFARRIEVIDRLEELLGEADQADRLLIGKAWSELEGIDIDLFFKIRAAIRTGAYTGEAFKKLVAGYVDFRAGGGERPGGPGYDPLDVFINGLTSFLAMPEPIKDLEPEMVYYQKTPARVVFEWVEKSHFSKEDVFFDLGSGPGQVAMLVNLLTGIATKGVEFEPAFCAYARACAAELNLSNVTFMNVDARKADYSEGTIFFMYTPFRGEILREVLVLLRNESRRRKIKLITYGPCTARVALESWLDFEGPADENVYTPGVFCSF